ARGCAQGAAGWSCHGGDRVGGARPLADRRGRARRAGVRWDSAGGRCCHGGRATAALAARDPITASRVRFAHWRAGMSREPLVSMIVPCHNYGRFLAEAVDSLLGQTLEALEVIVIDDASSDETPAVLQRYLAEPKLQAIRHQRRHGHLVSYNEGLAQARGRFVGILSADDYCLERTALERQVGLFETQ